MNRIKKNIDAINAALDEGQEPRDIANQYGIEWNSFYSFFVYHYNRKIRFAYKIDPADQAKRDAYAEKNAVKKKVAPQTKESFGETNAYLRAIERKGSKPESENR